MRRCTVYWLPLDGERRHFLAILCRRSTDSGHGVCVVPPARSVGHSMHANKVHKIDSIQPPRTGNTVGALRAGIVWSRDPQQVLAAQPVASLPRHLVAIIIETVV